MSISLVAVFIPILLMGGIVGRLFREFAVTLSRRDCRLAGRFADHHADDVRDASCKPQRSQQHGRLYRASERGFRVDARHATSAASAGCCGISRSMLSSPLSRSR